MTYAEVIDALKAGTHVSALGRANGWILRSLLGVRGPIPNLPAV